MRISDWSSDVCSSDLRASLVRASKRDRRIPMLEVKRGEARGAAFLVRFGCWDRGNGCGYRFVEMRCAHRLLPRIRMRRSEEHTSELQSLLRISYAGFCLKKNNIKT